ncbi:MarR family transcriptional regulator [Streptomyces shenzhenensis]|uniref:MarR family transcriptional regulator n=1 Tax=Streptomyces shenzhenensis TaxID=943815 RepID=UPI0015F05ABB|nr:MarR family transcriptional regulator [Streptomyces shenzhenensis]
MALAAANEWVAGVAEDCAALSAALCLCVCAAGMFGEDLLQRGYHRDREVLAYIAVYPGVAIRHIACVIGAFEQVVARNLDRLTSDGLGQGLVVQSDT